jgi:NhaA family Na+:H+ antiporter
VATTPESQNMMPKNEALAGIILLIAAVAALLIANSPLQSLYFESLGAHLRLGISPFVLDKSLLHWVNDGLMVIFFFLVGLEIKREVVEGALSSPQRASLPVIAALGGMIVPALIYVAFNWGDSAALNGWAIPAATDIAFAVGVLALVGRGIPPALKIFLLALAIIDDLGAIIIIALFYTSNLSITALALAAAGVAMLAILNYRRTPQIWPYVLVGAFIWLCVLKSGVHATLAGVVTALAVPIIEGDEEGPLERLEHAISPYVTFAILPLFAFANAGVSMEGITLSHILSPIPLGIALGLFAGKAIGIYSFARAAIAMRMGEMPEGANQIQLFGVSVLGGIGFTMSLFIGTLAFTSHEAAAEVRIGVLAGSLLSAIAGYLILTRNRSPA